VADRQRIFSSTFWKALFAKADIKFLMSSSYYPQTNEQTERVNQCLEMYLRCAVHDSPKQWKGWLSLAEFWYNSNYHTALGCSPFQALYGYNPLVGMMLLVPDAEPSPADVIVRERADHLARLKQHLAAAQNHMKNTSRLPSF
jgi:hypothetical protein